MKKDTFHEPNTLNKGIGAKKSILKSYFIYKKILSNIFCEVKVSFSIFIIQGGCFADDLRSCNIHRTILLNMSRGP